VYKGVKHYSSACKNAFIFNCAVQRVTNRINPLKPESYLNNTFKVGVRTAQKTHGIFCTNIND